MRIRAHTLALLLICLLSSCSEDEINSDNYSTKEKSEDEDRQTNDCSFEDGTHSASVDYYNPNTGHSATYTLEVEVEDCEVTTIHFPNGGWLDDSHISPAELNEDGDAELEDEQGRTFSVHIDNLH
jgi:hypothetical protein